MARPTSPPKGLTPSVLAAMLVVVVVAAVAALFLLSGDRREAAASEEPAPANPFEALPPEHEAPPPNDSTGGD